MPKKNCGQLILTAGIILTKYQDLVPIIIELSSPNQAFQKILEMKIEGVTGKKLNDLARAAQALRTILRDYPEEWSHIQRMFNLPNI